MLTLCNAFMKKLKIPVIQTKKDTLIIQNFPGYFLMGCLAVSFIFLYRILSSYVTVLILGAILATAFYPLYKKVLAFFKNKARFASLVSCFLVLILIVVPLAVFAIFLGKQALDTVTFIRDQLQSGFFDPYFQWEPGGIIYDALNPLRQLGILNIDNLDIKTPLLESLKTLSPVLINQGTVFLRSFATLLLHSFILFFGLYYFFKDSGAIIKKLMILSPLPFEYEKEIAFKFKEISLATLYGTFLTSVVQGIIGGIGFAIAGIPNALFWGTAIAFFSLIPIVGTATVWFPASVILLLMDNYFSGIFLLLWGFLLVSTVDNFLRAYLIGGRTKMNQLLTFLAVFGGISAFGLEGVIFGPLILTLFFTFLHIYEMEYDGVLHQGRHHYEQESV